MDSGRPLVVEYSELPKVLFLPNYYIYLVFRTWPSCAQVTRQNLPTEPAQLPTISLLWIFLKLSPQLTCPIMLPKRKSPTLTKLKTKASCLQNRMASNWSVSFLTFFRSPGNSKSHLINSHCCFRNFYVFEVDRDLEFSPLKNADPSGVDCPATCKRDLARVHASWLKKLGIHTEKTVFISPLLTYDGEDLNREEVEEALRQMNGGNWLSIS